MRRSEVDEGVRIVDEMWDEMVVNNIDGKSYSSNWRLTRSDKVREADYVAVLREVPDHFRLRLQTTGMLIGRTARIAC